MGSALFKRSLLLNGIKAGIRHIHQFPVGIIKRLVDHTLVGVLSLHPGITLRTDGFLPLGIFINTPCSHPVWGIDVFDLLIPFAAVDRLPQGIKELGRLQPFVVVVGVSGSSVSQTARSTQLSGFIYIGHGGEYLSLICPNSAHLPQAQILPCFGKIQPLLNRYSPRHCRIFSQTRSCGHHQRCQQCGDGSLL